MEIIVGILAMLVFLLAGALAFIFLRKSEAVVVPTDDKPFLMLQSEMQELRRVIDSKITESSRDMQDSMRSQLGASQRVVGEVTEKLTRLEETNRQVVSYSEQLQRLQDILQNPKQRGILGEYYLESVLQNALPPGSFAMQYAFENGEIVDAVVFVKDKVIPIDSKFSLENYNRLLDTRDEAERARLEKLFKQDMKNRIDETSKYVRPNENTLEFAFMFIPSEGLYYDVLVGSVGTGISARDLVEYAFTKKVIIVSPTSFLAYLQTVLQGLRGMQIEESAKEIRKHVENLGRHIAKYEDYYKRLGTSLTTSVSHYNAGYKELGKIDKDVIKISGIGGGIEPIAIDKPHDDFED
ncbi:MAG: DNA recombination protein RmuC [Patescibacteria group bacterium]